jgi:hypothetical protein
VIARRDRPLGPAFPIGCRSAIGDVILSVRTVRNNVFHGGKCPDGMITDPLRDEQLIRDCLGVLSALLLLPLPKGVAENFKP